MTNTYTKGSFLHPTIFPIGFVLNSGYKRRFPTVWKGMRGPSECLQWSTDTESLQTEYCMWGKYMHILMPLRWDSDYWVIFKNFLVKENCLESSQIADKVTRCNVMPNWILWAEARGTPFPRWVQVYKSASPYLILFRAAQAMLFKILDNLIIRNFCCTEFWKAEVWQRISLL